jgi:AP-2 complex subunit mu-1
MKSQLSGMPECKFGINEKLSQQEKGDAAHVVDTSAAAQKGIQIDDIKFHQCVRLGRFDRDRSITFIPPDGVFEVMTYRVSSNINLPFKITPVVQEYPDDNKVEYSVKLRSIFEAVNFANNVVVKVPVPPTTADVKIFSAGQGKAKYEPEKSLVTWRIKKFQGNSEQTLTAIANVMESKSQKTWQRPPITIEFQVPMFTGSGLRVRFMRIQEKSGYKPKKWIRYISRAGDYAHRI